MCKNENRFLMNKTILPVLFIFFSIASFSQVKVQVFDGNNGADADKKTEKNYSLNDKNLISLNTYLLGRGIFALSYERMLTPMHSLAISAGLTYRDLIFEMFQKDEIYPSNESSGNYISKMGTRGGAGYMFDVNYKFYPKSYDDFEGFYLSPGFILKHYSYSDKFEQSSLAGYTYNSGYTYSSGSSKNVEQPITYNLSELSLKFGYMYESWWYDGLIVDFYCGFGYRTANITSYEVQKIPDPSAPQPNSSYYSYQLSPTSSTIAYPCVYLGAKFGIPF